MRALFLMALLLNIAFLYWQYTREPEITRSVTAIAPGVERLRLIDEGEDSEQAFTDATGQAASTAEQAVQPDADSTQADVPELAPLKPAPPCLVAGPIAKQELALQLSKLISQSTGATALSRQVEVTIHQYWIFLPPAASLTEAQKLADALGEHGLKDYQVLASPGKKNAISLGLYSEKASAQRRFEQIRELGYEPRIDVIERVTNRYELLIRPESGELMQPARIRPLLPKGLAIGIRRDECE